MKYMILVLSVLIGHSGLAQGNYLGLSFGYGEYEMQDMKNFQASLAGSSYSPVFSEMVVSYPANNYWSVTFGKDFRTKQRLGLLYQFHKTGGRNNMSDYSGSYTLDLSVTQHTLGLSFAQLFLPGRIKLVSQLTAGASISYLIVEEDFNLYNEELINYRDHFVGLTFHIEPSGGINFEMNKSFNFEFLFGYGFTGIASYRAPGNPKLILSSPSRRKAKTNWTGMRIMATLYFKLPTNQE